MNNKNKNDTSWQNIARWYKDVPKKKGGYHSTVLIPEILDKLKTYVKNNGKVLDLACGEGSVTNEIYQAGYKVVGVDLSNDLIANAKHSFPDIHFFQEDAKNLSGGFLKFIDKVDAVVCVLALQNIDDIDKVFEEVKKVLNPHGIFIFIINHPYFRIPKSTSWGFQGLEKQYRIVEKYLSKIKIPILAHPGKQNSEISYSFHRPLQDYIKSLSRYGFTVIDITELISNKVSENGKRADAENLARKEIPMFMSVVAKNVVIRAKAGT